MPENFGLAGLWIALPANWLARGIGLRLRQSDDFAFLRDLYRRTRAEEVAAAGFDSLTAALFLNSQFDLQCRHFAAHYTLGGQRIVVTAQDQPIGRIELWISDVDGRFDLRVVDISLLPEWRGQGLGAALLAAVQQAAATEGRSVSLHVDKLNRAYRLYTRLGFRKAADAGASWRMEWRPTTKRRLR
ncbi:GNAT family N-acetyltransferase [Magnetospirillum molischianum]|uniref:Histone acetyltransferase HPA2 and related acetyltransferase n=1 Tax=Magnetospirillum molischianum DSM 120 TaxID=1150626 RepID=H8FQD8_MAGML|nr:GNAT family N-acetyltransferase [Magnetospirillum molischianum]CCG40576.1 Histone acetyltransferase HPA2 and related acetyltransferase [Magnetospirillum molischianum DSM 120]